jgi:hypothetical protein
LPRLLLTIPIVAACGLCPSVSIGFIEAVRDPGLRLTNYGTGGFIVIMFPDRDEQESLTDSLGLIDRWYIATSANGSLWIQPRKDVLELREFCTLLKRIHRAFSDRRFNVLILCFDGVETPRSLWLIMLRLLTAFAKVMQANCRIFRCLEDAGHAAVGCRKPESAPGAKGPPRHSKPMMKLNEITIIIEPQSGKPREFGMG